MGDGDGGLVRPASGRDLAASPGRVPGADVIRGARSRGQVYRGSVPAQPVMTAEELFERVRRAPPPTDDDVTILWDGRRLDSKEEVLEWLAEVEAARVEEAAAGAEAEA